MSQESINNPGLINEAREVLNLIKDQAARGCPDEMYEIENEFNRRGLNLSVQMIPLLSKKNKKAELEAIYSALIRVPMMKQLKAGTERATLVEEIVSAIMSAWNSRSSGS